VEDSCKRDRDKKKDNDGIDRVKKVIQKEKEGGAEER
jgi:hypothetical protein